MTQPEFKIQLERLIKTFPRCTIQGERLEILWEEVRDFSAEWLARVIRRFISEREDAPGLKDFREAAAEERNRLYKVKRVVEEIEAEEFASTFSASTLKEFCEAIRNKILGGSTDLPAVQDSDFGTVCKGCKGDGILFAVNKVSGIEAVFRCLCEAGKARRVSYPEWSAAMKQTWTLRGQGGSQ